jgi:4-hydroxybenzoate polyprenyltransferase
MTIKDAVVSLRPAQWTKNLFVAAALIFAKKVFDVPLLLRTLAAFAVFCLLSGAIYIVNDVLDAAEDRLHPRKSRPV